MKCRIAVVVTATLLSQAPCVFADVSPACRPVVDAELKVLSVDHSTSTTRDGKTSEGIASGGVIYVQVQGQWRKTAVTQAEMVKSMQAAIDESTAYSCQALPDDAVDGVAAAVYQVHQQSPQISTDAKIWVSKATGLPLRTEEDVLIPAKRHLSVRYGYTNIHPPAGQ